MIAEYLTTHTLHCMFLALTPSERWNAASNPLDSSFALEEWSTTILVLALVISIAVVCTLFGKKRQLDRKYKANVNRLSASNERLMEQVDELTQQLEAKASGVGAASEGQELKGFSEVPEETEEPVTIQ
jgi:outer membrane murein-binding lipoprotein Lpp